MARPLSERVIQEVGEAGSLYVVSDATAETLSDLIFPSFDTTRPPTTRGCWRPAATAPASRISCR